MPEDKRKPEKVSRREAQEIVGMAQFGFLVVADVEPVPLIGGTDVESFKFKVTVEPYQFGDKRPMLE